MRRTKTNVVMMLIIPMAMTLLMVLPGCAQSYGGYDGYGYADPEWDGQLYIQGGYDRGYHNQAFRNEGGRHPVAVGSDRGRASMGSRASGGGHAPSGGAGHAPSGGGGHAPSGGGRK